MKIISLSEIPFVLLLGVMKTIIVVSRRNLGEDINDPPAETNHVYSQSVSQSVTGVACETINISWKHYTITITIYSITHGAITSPVLYFDFDLLW